ncbi:MAG: glutamate-5-semialdehyde dehydrogenase [Candidatus Aenigmarchaeota archaeon]|nr:glutamate-5-semialdehyde dehydrogenase [Candidatus Aenigmarchaeota archaeon]
MNDVDIRKKIDSIVCDAKSNLASIMHSNVSKRDLALKTIADLLIDNKNQLLEENRKDIESAKSMGLPDPMIERLTLDEKTIEGMVESIGTIINLKDPLNRVLEERKLKNGVFLKKISVPIGVIGIIYESRPNVTVDCAALCIKSGNACILKGGKEALHSNRFLSGLIKKGCAMSSGLNENVVQFIDITDREAIKYLLQKNDFIDLIIPRGGEGLIKFIVENSKIPVIKQYKGICHVYVDDKADIDKAIKICINAKVQRPSVCNAIECIVVHEKAAKEFLPVLKEKFDELGVEIRGCKRTADFIDCVSATEKDWDSEFLDLTVAVRIVGDLDEAIGFINEHGTKHSEAIISENEENTEKFFSEIDAACLYSNTSTRFTDGFEFDMGAEIGISTDKIHARGPMGLKELTTYKYLLKSNGLIR